MSARSFSFPLPNEGASREAFAQKLASLRADVKKPSGALLFTSKLPDSRVFVEAARAAMRGVPTCIVPAAGVLSERGEIEGAPGIAGLFFEGGVSKVFVADAEATSLREALEETEIPAPSAIVLFARAAPSEEVLATLKAAAPSATIFGAGTPGTPAVAFPGGGVASSGAIAGMVFGKVARPLIAASSACKLLGELEPFEVTQSGLIETIGGSPALDRLTAVTRSREPGGGATPPLVLAALARGDELPFFRPIRGVDPSRRAVLVGADAKPGMRMAFAVRDAATARAGLDEIARDLLRQASGSAPRFAIHVTCAGRGQGLYGAADVEARLLRQRFGDLPIVGMHSAFELVPRGEGEARVSVYTAVLALFRSPS